MTAPPAGLPKEVCVTSAYLELFHHNSSQCVLVQLRLCFVTTKIWWDTYSSQDWETAGRRLQFNCKLQIATANCNCKLLCAVLSAVELFFASRQTSNYFIIKRTSENRIAISCLIESTSIHMTSFPKASPPVVQKVHQPLTGSLSLSSWTCRACTWCAAAPGSARRKRSAWGFCRSPGGRRWRSWNTPPAPARRTPTCCRRPLQGPTDRVSGIKWG